MPARYVISTAMIPVPALTVPARFRTFMKLETHTDSCLLHGQNNLPSLSQGRSLMTSATLAVLHWINVHAYTATVFIILESPTITAVDPGKITTWVPLFGCHIQTHVKLCRRASKGCYFHAAQPGSIAVQMYCNLPCHKWLFFMRVPSCYSGGPNCTRLCRTTQWLQW